MMAGIKTSTHDSNTLPVDATPIAASVSAAAGSRTHPTPRGGSSTQLKRESSGTRPAGVRRETSLPVRYQNDTPDQDQTIKVEKQQQQLQQQHQQQQQQQQQRRRSEATTAYTSEDDEGGEEGPSGSGQAVEGRWTKQEHDKLAELVTVHGTLWKTIARKLPGRTSKQCRERWLNHGIADLKKVLASLSPFLYVWQQSAEAAASVVQVRTQDAPHAYSSHTTMGLPQDMHHNILTCLVRCTCLLQGAWSLQEDYFIARLYTMYGSSWTKIAPFLSGRSDNSIKNRWNTKRRNKHPDPFTSEGEGDVLWTYVHELMVNEDRHAAWNTAVQVLTEGRRQQLEEELNARVAAHLEGDTGGGGLRGDDVDHATAGGAGGGGGGDRKRRRPRSTSDAGE